MAVPPLLAVIGLTLSPRASSPPPSRYASLDWSSHYYPVHWLCDLPLDKPTKTTLFDEDYVVVVYSDGREPLALKDECPHRLAALSEGRVTKQVGSADPDREMG